jgi:hypothetical protein
MIAKTRGAGCLQSGTVAIRDRFPIPADGAVAAVLFIS